MQIHVHFHDAAEFSHEVYRQTATDQPCDFATFDARAADGHGRFYFDCVAQIDGMIAALQLCSDDFALAVGVRNKRMQIADRVMWLKAVVADLGRLSEVDPDVLAEAGLDDPSALFEALRECSALVEDLQHVPAIPSKPPIPDYPVPVVAAHDIEIPF